MSTLAAGISPLGPYRQPRLRDLVANYVLPLPTPRTKDVASTVEPSIYQDAVDDHAVAAAESESVMVARPKSSVAEIVLAIAGVATVPFLLWLLTEVMGQSARIGEVSTSVAQAEVRMAEKVGAVKDEVTALKGELQVANAHLEHMSGDLGEIKEALKKRR